MILAEEFVDKLQNRTHPRWETLADAAAHMTILKNLKKRFMSEDLTRHEMDQVFGIGTWLPLL